MTPDERFALDLWAMQYGMDSADVDAALSHLGDPTPAMARAAIAAYALRRDIAAGRAARELLPAARAAVHAWRAGDQDALDAALAELESALLLASFQDIREE